jgi:hypothetical protein
LENSPHFFQPLEKYFPIIGKPPFRRRATRLCVPRNGPTGEVRLNFFADYTRFDNRIETTAPDE